ncbi:MAG: ATP-binding cassette domain-containing protein [Ferruginibacter sp.]|nr:ATP-binding cassette domain-containing protein [Ferruginibacter sp.]
MICIENLNKSYNANVVLRNVSFNAEKGDIICFFGKTGQGKTTLFNIISHLEKPDSGIINISYINNEIEYVFQEDLLLPWLNVRENILLNTNLKSIKCKNDSYTNVLSKLELEGYENYFPFQLSGGTKRKISLARSLICNPKLLILDEPFNGLDFTIKSKIETLLKELVETREIEVILYSSHIIESSIAFASKLFVLSDSKELKIISIDEQLRKSIIYNLATIESIDMYR